VLSPTVPYFAILYWTLDKYKCVYGIWLVPISECVNGMLKYYFKVRAVALHAGVRALGCACVRACVP